MGTNSRDQRDGESGSSGLGERIVCGRCGLEGRGLRSQVLENTCWEFMTVVT